MIEMNMKLRIEKRLLMGAFLVASALAQTSCSKEGFTLFNDTGCVYKGTLEVQRPLVEGFVLKTALNEDGEVSDTHTWASSEKERASVVGRHLAVYASEEVLGLVDWQKGALLPPPSKGDQILGYDKPVVAGVASGTVAYDEKTTISVSPRELTKGVKLSVENASKGAISSLQVIVEDALVGVDLFTGKEEVKRPLLLNEEPLRVLSGAVVTPSTYIPKLKEDALARLSFVDEEGVRYAIPFPKVFALEGGQYKGKVTITDDLLKEYGAIVREKNVSTTVDVINIPGKGGVYRVPFEVIQEEVKLQNGVVKERKEKKIPYRVVGVDGDEYTDPEAIVVREGDGELIIEVLVNNGERPRKGRVLIEADGERIEVPFVQERNAKVVVIGEIQ